MVTSPSLTVLLACTGSEPQLAETFASVLAQTFTDFQVMVFERSRSEELAKLIARCNDPRVIYRKCEETDGLLPLQQALASAKTKYFVCVPVGDISCTDRFGKQIAYLDSHPQIAAFGAQVKTRDSGRMNGNAAMSITDSDIRVDLLLGTIPNLSSYIFRATEVLADAVIMSCSGYGVFVLRLFASLLQRGAVSTSSETLITRQRVSQNPSPEERDTAKRIRCELIRALNIDVTEFLDSGITALNKLAYELPLTNYAEFVQYDRLLDKIVEANQTAKIYDNSKLSMIAVERYYRACLESLKRGSFFGGYYLRARLAQYRKLSVKERLVFRALLGWSLYVRFRRVLLREISFHARIGIRESMLSLGAYWRFIHYRPSCKSVIIVEPNGYHGECVPGITRYFQELGYSVLVFFRYANYKEDPFCRYPHKPEILCASQRATRWMLRHKVVQQYEWCFFNSNKVLDSSSPFKGEYINYLGFMPQTRKGVLFVDHEFRAEIPTKFTLGMDRLFLLNDWTCRWCDTKIPMLNPHYFGDAAAPRVKPSDKRIFVTVGEVTERNRNIGLILDVARRLEGEGNSHFEIWCIGRISLDIRAITVPRSVKLWGRLSYNEMFLKLDACDFFVPLLDPDIESHQVYFNGTTTGSLQLILGFHLVPIIHEQFARVYHLSAAESVIYKRGSFSSAFRAALSMSHAEWLDKKALVGRKAMRVYEESLANLHEKIETVGAQGG